MKNYNSNRIISTPTTYAKNHYLYVQETGSLLSIEPHVSRRDNLASLLFFTVTRGKGSIQYHGRRVLIQTGDCIFLNCLEEYAHESSKEDPWELSWVHFYGKEAASFYDTYCEQGGSFWFHPSDPSIFINTLGSIFREMQNKSPYYELKVHKYLTDLVTYCYLDSSITRSTAPLAMEKITSICSYIDEHFSDVINLDQLAALFFISKFHLSREFKRITGVTVGNYITEKRISEAKRLLRFTKEPIGSIAVSCGITDVNYFTKVFTKYEGMTPSNYRKKW